MKRRRRERRGSFRFTLIELCMICVVLMILLAIILPQLVRSKEYAKEKVCMNNLRQIALAYKCYWEDNDQQDPMPESGRFLDDFTPLFPYAKLLDTFKCPSTHTEPLTAVEDFAERGCDYLQCGDVSDVELRNSENNGHGNNMYHFDPSNPGRPTQALIEAKISGAHILYERTHSVHFPRKCNMFYIDNFHYEPEKESMLKYWTLDDRGWIDRSLDPWP